MSEMVKEQPDRPCTRCFAGARKPCTTDPFIHAERCDGPRPTFALVSDPTPAAMTERDRLLAEVRRLKASMAQQDLERDNLRLSLQSVANAFTQSIIDLQDARTEVALAAERTRGAERKRG